MTESGGVAKRFTPTVLPETVKMLLYRKFSRFVTFLATLAIVSHGDLERLQMYLRSDTESHAQFVGHHDRVLGIPAMLSVQVQDSFLCLAQCLRHESCQSVNFAVGADSRGYHICELLPSDKYTIPTEFKESYSFHHYSVEVRSKECSKREKKHNYFGPGFLESPGNFSAQQNLELCDYRAVLFTHSMKGGSLRTRSFRRLHFSVFRYR